MKRSNPLCLLYETDHDTSFLSICSLRHGLPPAHAGHAWHTQLRSRLASTVTHHNIWMRRAYTYGKSHWLLEEVSRLSLGTAIGRRNHNKAQPLSPSGNSSSFHSLEPYPSLCKIFLFFLMKNFPTELTFPKMILKRTYNFGDKLAKFQLSSHHCS